LSYGSEVLAVDGRNGLELELAAVGKRDGDQALANRIEAVPGNDGIGDGFGPLLAEIGGLLDSDVFDSESPAYAEVALAFVSRVIGADYLDGKAG